MNDYHVPVLLSETIEYLKVAEGEKYIDCTLGGGGHTRTILNNGGIVLGIDQDIEAIKYVEENTKSEIRSSKLIIKQGNFAHLKEIADQAGFNPVAGILFDLGVSSHQLESADRGFSFNRSELLDMRMNPEAQAVTAADLINAASETELTNIFWKYGQEQQAHKIAIEIVRQRRDGRINSAADLVKIILRIRRQGKGDRNHPATRVFQALRIAVNDELASLEEALPQARDLLKAGGILAAISFHSLEDRIVKNFFKDNQLYLQVLSDKPITPGKHEIDENPRARSGKLRVAQKI